MIEALAHFRREYAIELAEIDDHARCWINCSGHCDVAHIAVPVIILTRAQSKYANILFVGPVRSAIAMRGGEGHAAREERRHDQFKARASIGSRAPGCL